MKRLYKNIIPLLLLAVSLSAACVGPDYQPDLFGLNKSETYTTPPPPSENPPVEVPAIVEIYKLIINLDGRQIEVPIPNGQTLEVGSGTFIAMDETDVGPKYTATSKFKIANTGSKSVNISIPRQLGAFSFSSTTKLELSLAPNQSMIITITFRPTVDTVSEGGKVSEEFLIGDKTYSVTAEAVESSGRTAVNVINDSGGLEMANTSSLAFGEVGLSAQALKKFFKCSQISCNGDLMVTNCSPCLNVTDNSCELLTVNKSGEPVNEVNDSCAPATRDTDPAREINLSGTDVTNSKVSKKVVELLNTGTEPVTINKISIKEITSSGSERQFSVNPEAVYLADSFEEIGEAADFPIVLPPFDPPVLSTRLFVVVAYHPNDILGSNGMPASVGSSAKDEAILNIETDDGSDQLILTGMTTIIEVPALQIFVKSSTGIRPIANRDVLPFKGITVETSDLAIPLFMKLSDAATVGLRISGISLSGDSFEWLDTKDKIDSKPEGSKCSIPVLDENGSQIDIITDLNPVSLGSNGFALDGGSFTVDTMPLFGCINFHRDPGAPLETTTFNAEMLITAQELTAGGQPAINPDGSVKETSLTFSLLGVIDPLKGQLVMRLAQTMAIIMNPQFPSVSAAASDDEMNLMIGEGRAKEEDRDLFIMAMHLDPFDEDLILNPDGSIASTPGDGITAVFRPIDTRAVPVTYDDPYLLDYTTLLYDSLLPEGKKGIFEDFPNVPENFRANGLKLFTATLSYPGPLAAPEEKPEEPSACELVDPCSAGGQRRLGEGPSNSRYKGVCAFFYVTAGDGKSPAFHYPTEDPSGNRRDMCEDRETPYDLEPIRGKYSLDGKMEFGNIGMLFQGPTYFHNPSGPLGPVTPLEEKFDITFTTETLLPPSETGNTDRLPDKRIDTAKGEYRINLNDPYSDLPQFCDNNSGNRFVLGNYLSTWRYISPLLKKDKDGLTPAGCPEQDNNFTGGIAYLSGKRLDQTTGHASFVSAAKFSSSENLTFAFKDVMIFLVLNGWFCDPLGPEEEMEGSHCYDKTFNHRDAATQYSIMRSD